MPNLQSFAGVAHEAFDLSVGEATMPLTLVEVAPLPATGLNPQPFSLVFRGTSAIVLPQKMYSLSNATLGRLSIFLVPIGRDPAGVLYQAVFN
ncbi:MAG: DUF6916 family protein [Brevundimonas aurantiaca]|jgi:hypothetical protein|uniref:DUF6916 family protein n=1 Tax=Brevundimonas aurantiaca TaxID=74316 RepID=UPI0015FFC59D|nr:hypothetical protein [Brevundimonas sp.]MBB1177639.1 hypothetical protein [Pseudomonas sp. FW305-3-2-15-E-TSA4]